MFWFMDSKSMLNQGLYQSLVWYKFSIILYQIAKCRSGDFLGFFCQIDISGFYKHCTNMAPSKKEGGVNGGHINLYTFYKSILTTHMHTRTHLPSLPIGWHHPFHNLITFIFFNIYLAPLYSQKQIKQTWDKVANSVSLISIS